MKLLAAFKRGRGGSWGETQKRLPAWMQDSIVPHLDTAREYGILVLRPHLSACQLSGPGQGGPLTVTFATNGSDRRLKLFLADLLFTAEPEERDLGNVPLWRLGQLINASPSDLTFIGAGKHLLQHLPFRKAILLPRSVGQALDVRGSWDDVVKRLHTTVRRNELRLVRKYEYEYELSHQEADFEMFFHQMYRPSMRARHGQQAHMIPYEKAYHTFKEGVLFLVKRQGVCVSSGLCDITREPGAVHFLMEGVRQGDEQLLKEGAQSTLYYAVIHWANGHGYETVDFEATEPFLKKGILQHKRKWGLRVEVKLPKRIWLKIHRATPAVAQFLEENPVIAIDKQDRLQGLFFAGNPEQVPAETRDAWAKLCDMPGMNGYQVRSLREFLD